MEDLAIPAPPAPLTWRQRLSSPRVRALTAAGLVVGAALAGGIWWLKVKPRVEAAQKLYDATMDLWALYDLQMERKKLAGTYANGLDALLATAKDAQSLKARLAAHVDLNTAAIVGGSEGFKIELNILDQDRTLLKIRGPIGKRLWTGRVAAPLPEVSASSDGLGAPVGR